VIGHDSIDKGLSKLANVFPIVVSAKCVLLRMNKKVFDEKIWKRLKSQELEVRTRRL
jgi:hypothetical protein